MKTNREIREEFLEESRTGLVKIWRDDEIISWWLSRRTSDIQEMIEKVEGMVKNKAQSKQALIREIGHNEALSKVKSYLQEKLDQNNV